MLLSSALVPVFLLVQDWLTFPVLVLLGFFSLSSGTIFLALVQDNFQHHRNTGNSVYILISFLSNAIMLILIGFLGDNFGLRAAYWIGAISALLSVPALRLLPSIPPGNE
jgi:MFS family permease